MHPLTFSWYLALYQCDLFITLLLFITFCYVLQAWALLQAMVDVEQCYAIAIAMMIDSGVLDVQMEGMMNSFATVSETKLKLGCLLMVSEGFVCL